MFSDPFYNPYIRYLDEALDKEHEQGSNKKGEKEKPLASSLGKTSGPRVQEIVYKIKQLAKNSGVSIERAYYDYMKKATLGGLERAAVKQKLGIGVGTSVNEAKLSDKDYDKDRKLETPKQEHRGVRNKAITRAVRKESFGWRHELKEVIGVDRKKNKTEDKITDKPNINNKIEINPKLNENINLFVEYLLSEGLNEYGIEILVDEMGVEQFCEFFEDFSDDLLTESSRARRQATRGAAGMMGSGMTKTGKSFKDVKGGARTSSRNAARKVLGRTEGTPRHAALNRPGNSDMKSSLSRQAQISKASRTQPKTSSTPTQTKEKAKKGVFGHLKHSWQTARDVGREHEKRVARAAGTVAGAVAGAAKFAHEAGKRAGQSETGKRVKKDIQKTGKAASSAASAGAEHKRKGGTLAGAAGRAAGTFVRKLRNEGYEIDGELIENLVDLFVDLHYEGYDIEDIDADNLFESYLEEKKKSDPCWKKYRQRGIKNKGGKKVPNCVPVETEFNEGLGAAIMTAIKKGKARHDVAMTNRERKKREKKIPYAALTASAEIEGELIEKAPPGDKYERMVKHIKKTAPKKVAYATAWKQYNKKKLGEESDMQQDLDSRRQNQQDEIERRRMAAKERMIQKRSDQIEREFQTAMKNNERRYELKKQSLKNLNNSYEPLDEIHVFTPFKRKKRKEEPYKSPKDPKQPSVEQMKKNIEDWRRRQGLTKEAYDMKKHKKVTDAAMKAVLKDPNIIKGPVKKRAPEVTKTSDMRHKFDPDQYSDRRGPYKLRDDYNEEQVRRSDAETAHFANLPDPQKKRRERKAIEAEANRPPVGQYGAYIGSSKKPVYVSKKVRVDAPSAETFTRKVSNVTHFGKNKK